MTITQSKHVLRASREGGHYIKFPLPDWPWIVWCKPANVAAEPGVTKSGCLNKSSFASFQK